MKDKLILFDWGNIVESHLTGYSCKNAWRDLFVSCGYTGNEDIFSNLAKYKVTKIRTIEEYEKTYIKMAEEFKFRTTFKEYVSLYKKIFEKIDYYKDVADYEISLKDRCYIGIFSNLTLFDKERLNKQVNLSNYDYTFLSFEMGLRKPEIEIYKQIQGQLQFKPNNILFIDDKEDNIKIASKIGWDVLQATGLELDKIKEKCESFLIK